MCIINEKLGGFTDTQNKSNPLVLNPPFKSPETLKIYEAPQSITIQPPEKHINEQTTVGINKNDNSSITQQTKQIAVIPEAAILEQFGSSWGSIPSKLGKRRKKSKQNRKFSKKQDINFAKNMARKGRFANRNSRNHYKPKNHKKTKRHNINNRRSSHLTEYI